MDFPIFHLDFMGDRLLIAIIAVLHVLINHGLAVGFIPLVTWLEYIGYKKGGQSEITNTSWDKLAYHLMTVAFIITTTIGAMTGVGIWFASSLVNPASIGSLIRVFYGAWFVEWMVFVTEVVLILIYYLSWKKSLKSIKAKAKHIKLGASLSIFSWVTMSIIVSILGFMMDTGSWVENKTFVSGFANPIYLPQLAFRTPLAALMGGSIALFLCLLFTKKNTEIRQDASRAIAKWMLIATPFTAVAAFWYHSRIPHLMIGNLPVAVGTMDFQLWYDLLVKFIWGALGSVLIVAGFTYFKPQIKLPKVLYIVPVIGMLGFAGIFERIREFIRKPYVIGNYMYSNTLRKEDYPLYKRDGLLAHAVFSPVKEVTEANKLVAGEQVFLLACSRCHTTNGINSIVEKFENMYSIKNGEPLNPDLMKNYIAHIENARYFMPPFPGNEKELGALVEYIKHIQAQRVPSEGVQERGIASVQ
jgi:mono/diheme cytochrome c family protein